MNGENLLMWTISVAALFAAYLLWRIYKYKTAAQWLKAHLPPSRCLSFRLAMRSQEELSGRVVQSDNDWRTWLGKSRACLELADVSESWTGSPKTVDAGKFSNWTAALDGFSAGAWAADAFRHIDPDFLRAIEFSTADHIHKLASIDSYVNKHFFAMPHDSAEGWLHRLEGYVAEQKAAAALEHAGGHVVFADIPNQPGWDLLVDGHPIQVKEGINAGHVKEFLSQHPDIPVVTGEDIASRIPDSHVHSLLELNHEHIAQSANESLQGINEGFHPTFHLPVVTLLFSTYREGKLLLDEKTTISTALAHIGTDVASVGVGSLVGVKTGALIGSILGPIGAAFGALLGGIGGAMTGKMAANGLRYAAFKQAHADYCRTVDEAQVAIQALIGESRSRVLETKARYESEFKRKKGKILQSAAHSLATVRQVVSNGIESLTRAFPEQLDELVLALRSEEREVLSALPKSGFGLLFPKDQDLLRSAIKMWFRRARKLVGNVKQKYLGEADRSPENLRVHIGHFLNDYDCELVRLHNDIRGLSETFAESQKAGEQIGADAIQEVKSLRAELIKAFGQQIPRIHAGLVRSFADWNGRIVECRAALQREAKPVGIDL